MNAVLLSVHNIVRWLILLSLVSNIIVNIYILVTKKELKLFSNLSRLTLVAFTDFQALTGLLMYFYFSPFIESLRENMKEAMHIKQLRFYAVEHIGALAVAVIGLHVMNTLIKKEGLYLNKARKMLYTSIVFAVILVLMIPWDRPFLRF